MTEFFYHEYVPPEQPVESYPSYERPPDEVRNQLF
jgi:hypothetical protein